jgi:hypothetical protein
MINSIQTRAIATSYGRRYTFVGATGCIVAEEGADGQVPDLDPERIRKQITGLLPKIPEKMRPEILAQAKKATPKDLYFLLSHVTEIRDRCQNKLVSVPKEQGKKKEKALAALKNVENMNELDGWESYVEDLKNADPQ